MKTDKAVIMLAVFCAVMVAGALLTDWADHTGLDADVTENDDGTVQVTMNSTFPAGYGWMLYTGSAGFTHVCLYLDDEYGSPVGYSDQDDFMDSMKRYLESRGVSCSFVDAAGLAEVMSDTGSASSTAVLMASGALPDTVYGEGMSVLKAWLEAGGTLYWMYGIIGETVSVRGGVEEGGTPLLGEGAQLEPGEGAFASDISPWAEALRYRNTDAVYGLSTDLPGFTDLGLTTGSGHSSCGAVPYGSGSIVVIGGSIDGTELGQTAVGRNLALADIISMGLASGSELVDSGTGSKGYGSTTFTISGGGAEALYLWSGDYNSEWGQRFILRSV